ncbi:unnamed protein product [Meloidogyne enterolobii]|uniref:Uncharacterized protein n=1 Tax=Meloidogyne enterolobii TaxID=390850 RepID=A0ACB1A8N6_MELEN
MYLKLILNIFFLLILINISNGELCKCDKKTGKILRNHRYKRGFKCNCFSGGAGSSKKGSDEGTSKRSSGKGLNKGKKPAVENFSRFEKDEIKKENAVKNFDERMLGGYYNFDQDNSSKKRVLYIADNFFYSHIQFNVSLKTLI